LGGGSARRKATPYTQNKCTHRHPCVEWDSNTEHQLDRAKTGSCLRPRSHCNRLCTQLFFVRTLMTSPYSWYVVVYLLIFSFSVGVRVVSEESRRLFLPRTSCYFIRRSLESKKKVYVDIISLFKYRLLEEDPWRRMGTLAYCSVYRKSAYDRL
jgi:hypothetical protein